MLGSGDAMLVWMLQPAAEVEHEWNEWYDLEHVPALLEVPGFLSGNRFRLTSCVGLGAGAPARLPDYLACYELEDPSALNSSEYHARRSSLLPGMRPEWTRRMLGAIVDAFGGVYARTGRLPTEALAVDEPVDELAVLLFAAAGRATAGLDYWLDEVVRPRLDIASQVRAHRSFRLLRGSPSISGMRDRALTPDRMVLCAVAPESDAMSLAAGMDYPDSGMVATLARYVRIR